MLIVKQKLKLFVYKHGEFTQIPIAHLSGQGCTLCRNEFNSLYNSENSTGWSCTNWEIRSKLSKNFDSFKVYVIECWNENEHFYKIGRTFQPVTKRFNDRKLMPYKFKIIKVFNGEVRQIFELEQKLKNMNKKNKYEPLIKFHGSKECYYKINKL